jgi:Isochorismatase family
MDAHTAPHLDRAALVTIDVQRDTLDGQPLEIPGTSAALTVMARLAEAFRSAGRPIVHVVRLYRRDGSNVDRCRRGAVEGGAPILAPGHEGSELAAGLAPDAAPGLDADALLAGELQPLGPAEWAMYKPRWGAFYETRSRRICAASASIPSPSAARTSQTARAPRSTRPASATSASLWPATPCRGSTTAAGTSSKESARR